ncbi:phosphoribosylpyrophosphate synthetase [Tunicatimonas pelagia]|uniref:phosphoribosylpyrophosphate synthetase n=1 Tax=Tunicatimonas pelagia TaxID=931531 RepID=UPI0026651465|nr:phosphoribosylpyrophosphate synthetase [Tunicatimonas pelagia]WKN43773.1 phosphoribosylpyrophosphate synthetase [Tunicatimonas pelagia]
MSSYDTLVEAINDLRKRGFEHDFNLEHDRLYCKQLKMHYRPKEFTITEVHRFEGMTDPGDNSVLYAVETSNHDKGVLVDAYGAYSEALSQEMIVKLKAGYQQ